MKASTPVTVQLTIAEAKAISRALDNCLGDEQDNVAVFGTKTNIAAAYSAADKMTKVVFVKTAPVANPAFDAMREAISDCRNAIIAEWAASGRDVAAETDSELTSAVMYRKLTAALALASNP